MVKLRGAWRVFCGEVKIDRVGKQPLSHRRGAVAFKVPAIHFSSPSTTLTILSLWPVAPLLPDFVVGECRARVVQGFRWADTTPMAEENSKTPPDSTQSAAAEISPSLRKRLEELFKYGEDKGGTGDHDYAHSMYAQCVANDPSSLKYVEAMLTNLNAKWAGKKGKCKVKESRAAFKKAVTEENWKKVFKEGADLLKDNPWDTPTLRSLAEACAANRYNEVELHYLKNALEAKPKDVDVNRHCATSLQRMGQYDQAIACWARIEEKVKTEARTKISELTMAKNRRAAGIVDENDEPRAAARQPDPKPESSADAAESSEETGQSGSNTSGTPQSREELEQAIVRQPEEIENYVRLAELLNGEKSYRDSEQVLRRALPVSGGSLKVQELLEKTQMRRSRSELAELAKKAKDAPDEEIDAKLASARRRNLRLELDVYAARSERYPDELRLKYEVGTRMKKLGNYEEAIPYFDAAEADPKHAAASMLYRGECLQQMKQYTEALKAYERSASTTDGTPAEVLQLALYRAGTLAIGLKDSVRAKNWLEKLLKMAPNYRDAASRLDKLG